ncbi:2-C-methyl-D-erythritol 4-phosphate cytidylyltransferase [Candidatus Thioglobus sp.]|nr:2-C-methyl-D-erythritol 4-phosphate cytidylyltransferase [Candidatus Thioglobus sp.]
MNNDNYYLIMPASGMGKRMKSETPKQYLKLSNGLTIIDQCLKTLLKVDVISGFVIALSEKDTLFKSSIYFNHSKMLGSAKGGKERFNSVLNALNSLAKIAKPNDWILVHDSVRPCVKKIDIEMLINEVSNHQTGGILATGVVDTIKQVAINGKVSTIDRSKLFKAQTPQMFRYGVLKDALEKAVKLNHNITDESEAIENLGYSIKIVVGSSSNIKITQIDDLEQANHYLQ